MKNVILAVSLILSIQLMSQTTKPKFPSSLIIFLMDLCESGEPVNQTIDYGRYLDENTMEETYNSCILI